MRHELNQDRIGGGGVEGLLFKQGGNSHEALLFQEYPSGYNISIVIIRMVKFINGCGSF